MLGLLDAWERYTAQLERVGAGVLLKLLQPGCEDSAFDEAEKVMGYPLSPEAKELYRLHDGQVRMLQEPLLIDQFLFPDGHWHPLQELVDTQQYLASFADRNNFPGNATSKSLLDDLLEYENESSTLGPGFYRLGWLPITANGCGDYECIDMAPGTDGRLGQVVSYTHDGGNDLAHLTLADFIDHQCRLLVTGEYIYDPLIGFDIAS